MSSIFRKNFHLCFSKIKCLPTSLSPPLTLHDDDDDDDVEYHVINNFNSIYDLSLSSSTATTTTTTTTATATTTTGDDFSTVFSSNRFFIASPGRSNSILDSSSSFSSGESSSSQLVGGGVPIRKYSPDPYVDFRRSMQEMVEARERDLLGEDDDQRSSDLEYLHELLICYLTLNPKQTHKFIIGAFADLLVSLMSSDVDNDNPNCRRRNSMAAGKML